MSQKVSSFDTTLGSFPRSQLKLFVHWWSNMSFGCLFLCTFLVGRFVPPRVRQGTKERECPSFESLVEQIKKLG